LADWLRGLRGLGIALLFLDVSVGHARAEPPGALIQWEVADRFRLLEGLGKEDLLNQIGATGLSANYDAIIDQLTGPAWIAMEPGLRERHVSRAHVTLKRPIAAYTDTYLRPDGYWIRVSAPEAGDRCQWFLDGAPVTERGNAPLAKWPCATPQLLWIKRDWASDAARVRVSFTSERTSGAEDIAVRDELIVSMGDSFSSGEGNPDVAAKLRLPPPLARTGRKHLDTVPWYDDLKELNSDKRERWAQWLDQPCHRSLLSQHALAALAYSAQHRQTAVTFVGLGCSGASIFDGLLFPQLSLPGDEKGADASQFSQLQDLLCEKRSDPAQWGTVRVHPRGWRARTQGVTLPIGVRYCKRPFRPVNRLFLTIGGNDIGFAGVIAWAVSPETGRGLFTDFTWALANDKAGVVCPFVIYPPHQSPKRCEKNGYAEQHIRQDLPVAYAALEQALSKLPLIEGGVFITQYPNALYSGLGTYHCPLYRNYDPPKVVTPGLDAFAVAMPSLIRGRVDAQIRGEREPAWIEKAVITPLNIQIAQSAKKQGWTLVPTPPLGLQGGWCALDRPDSAEALDKAGEREQRALTFPAGAEGFQPYLKRARLFRTANDSALTQFHGSKYIIQGAFHPTAQWHSLMADGLAAALGSMPPQTQREPP
jgi:hypothetical protein